MNKLNKFFEIKYHVIRNKFFEKNLFKRRLLISTIIILILSATLFSNLFYLQVKRNSVYTTRSNENRIKLLPMPPLRGLIYDRYGTKLVENIPFYGLYVVPEKSKNINEQFEKLKPIVGLTDDDIANFQKSRSLSQRFTPILLKGNLTEKQIAHFSVDKYQFPAFSVGMYFKRYYLFGELLTPVLGYVGKINDRDLKNLAEKDLTGEYAGTNVIGKTGIERYYEHALHGQVGFEKVEVNAHGRVLRKIQEQPAILGKNIYLTIDFELQRFIYNLLGDDRAAVVVMDPKDSSILAMVSKPSYDNNLFIDGISNDDYQYLLNNPDRPLYNRVIQGAYPPASTVKPFLAVAGLTEGVITPKTTMNTTGVWYIPNTQKRYRDWKIDGHGMVDLQKAITESVDTYFYQLAFELGIDRISLWMKRFGFGELTGLDLAEETAGNMPSREWKQKRYKQMWYQGDTIPVGIGQGYWTATPLQVAKALAILINNGKVNTPHLMMKMEGKTVEEYQDPQLSQDIYMPESSSWELVKNGMKGVINSPNGTAFKVFNGANYVAAGKSGTAQVFSLKEDQVYRAKDLKKSLHDHAWFIAYAPYKDPKILVVVLMENAGGGSRNAAPVAHQIIDYYLNERLPELNNPTISTFDPNDPFSDENNNLIPNPKMIMAKFINPQLKRFEHPIIKFSSPNHSNSGNKDIYKNKLTNYPYKLNNTREEYINSSKEIFSPVENSPVRDNNEQSPTN